MVVPPSPRFSSHFVRPFQDFIATTNSQLTERPGEVVEQSIENSTAVDDETEANDNNSMINESSLPSRQAQLLEAIVNNAPDDVQACFTLEHREHDSDDDNNNDNLDPNFSFVVSKIPRSDTGQSNIDLIFSVRAILGESPTPLHLAIMNIFFRHLTFGRTGNNNTATLHASRLLQNFIKPRPLDKSDIHKSHQIVQILMEHSANMRQPSPTMFCHEKNGNAPATTTPLEMAWRIHSALSKTKGYDMNEVEALLLSWEEHSEQDQGEDQRDDEDLRRNEADELDAAITACSSQLSTDMAQEILLNVFGDNSRQAKKAYTLHTVTSLGITGEEFESSTVVCGKGFHLLCSG